MQNPLSLDGSSDYALPKVSLNFLRQLIVSQHLERVFEFGCGKSTSVFLECGCETTSLEDSAGWLTDTEKQLCLLARSRWRPICQPLAPVFLNGAPMKGWPLDEATVQSLRDAQLVLIDSPSFPPFREHALVTALRTVRNGLVIVDDANIPTVRRFCQRLAGANHLTGEHLSDGHGFYLMKVTQPPTESGTSAAPLSDMQRTIRVARGFWETLKAWRRYALA